MQAKCPMSSGVMYSESRNHKSRGYKMRPFSVSALGTFVSFLVSVLMTTSETRDLTIRQNSGFKAMETNLSSIKTSYLHESSCSLKM
jgi:hypothetical protein